MGQADLQMAFLAGSGKPAQGCLLPIQVYDLFVHLDQRESLLSYTDKKDSSNQ